MTETTNEGIPKRRFGLFRSIAVSLIRLYQNYIGFLFYYHGCRFYPTCSEYILFCLKYLSIFKAISLSIWRILRCHPYSKGGEDLPPKYEAWLRKSRDGSCL